MGRAKVSTLSRNGKRVGTQQQGSLNQFHVRKLLQLATREE